MGDDRHPPSEYRWARQVSAVLPIAVVVLIVVLDVIVEGYEVSPPVLVPVLLTAESPVQLETGGHTGGFGRGERSRAYKFQMSLTVLVGDGRSIVSRAPDVA